MTNDELIAKIRNGTPRVESGRVVGFSVHEDPPEEIPVPDGCEAYLDMHPDGDDHGFTPYLFEVQPGRIAYGAGVFFDLATGEWEPVRPSGD